MERPMDDSLWGEEFAGMTPAGKRPVLASEARLEALLPWQRFLLAVLLFLNMTVVGFLLLVILGRFQLR